MKNINNTINETLNTNAITTEELQDKFDDIYWELSSWIARYYDFIEEAKKYFDSDDELEEILIPEQEVASGLEVTYIGAVDEPDLGFCPHYIGDIMWNWDECWEGGIDEDFINFVTNYESLNVVPILDRLLRSAESRLDEIRDRKREIEYEYDEIIDRLNEVASEYNELIDDFDESDEEELTYFKFHLQHYIYPLAYKFDDRGRLSFSHDCHVTKKEIVEDEEECATVTDIENKFQPVKESVMKHKSKPALDRSLLGFRENDVLDNLDKAEVVMNTEDHLVVRFCHIDGEHAFEYDFVTNKVVG